MKTEKNTCPRCGRCHIKKNGTTQGKQRYRCQEKACGRQFLFCLDYTYRACNPLYRELIVPMTLNGSGVHDIARVLHISPTTVLAVLRVAAAQTPEPRVPKRILALEMDEQWSFVQNKKQQCGSGMASTVTPATSPPLFWGDAPMPVAESCAANWPRVMCAIFPPMIGKAMPNLLTPNVTTLAKTARRISNAKTSTFALIFSIAAQNDLLFQSSTAPNVINYIDALD